MVDCGLVCFETAKSQVFLVPVGLLLATISLLVPVFVQVESTVINTPESMIESLLLGS
jgi:hypothetical protein